MSERHSARHGSDRLTPPAATFLVFVVNGAMIGSWVAHIPWVQTELDVSKSTIGITLLFMAAGALVAMPLTGHVLQSRSSAVVARITALTFCLLLPLPLLASGPLALGVFLFVFGAANGAMDVAMNAHGVAVERELERPVMSSLHGGWSIGGFAGSGLAALAAVAGVDPRVESLVVGVVLWLVAFVATARLGEMSAHTGHRSAGGLAFPARAVLLLGGLCFLAMLIEGAVADWSGIYLRDDLGAGTAVAATGFTAFSLGMAAARLGGDRLNERLGAGHLLRGGMALVAMALGAALLIAEPAAMVLGLALVGLGIANAVPLLFSAVGRVPPAGPSLAAVFTVGYMGFVVGPPAIGLLADVIGLPETLALLCVAAVAVAAAGRRAVEPAGSGAPEPAAA